MALQENSAEGGSNTTTVTTGNSGGASGTAFSSVTTSGTATATYSTAQAMHGSLSYRFYNPSATSDQTNVRLTNTSNMQVACRFYLYLPAYPSGDVRLLILGSQFVITQQSTGVLFFTGFGGNIGTATSALSTGVWYRLESQINVATSTTGYGSFAYYVGDSLTPVETINFTNVNFATFGITTATFGRNPLGGSVTSEAFMDDLAFQDGATSFIGPVSASSGSASIGWVIA